MKSGRDWSKDTARRTIKRSLKAEKWAGILLLVLCGDKFSKKNWLKIGSLVWTGALILSWEASVTPVSLHRYLKCFCVSQKAKHLLYAYDTFEAHHMIMSMMWGWSFSPRLHLLTLSFFTPYAYSWEGFSCFSTSIISSHCLILWWNPPLEPPNMQISPLDFTLERRWVECWSVLPSDLSHPRILLCQWMAWVWV